MKRLIVSAIALTVGLTACSANMGGPKDIPLTTVAVRAADGTSSASVAATITATTDVALVAASADSAWFAALGEAVDRTVSGPALTGDLALGFLGDEPLGDTTLVLSFDGGSLTVHDALYEPEEDRFLDLLAFRIDDPATTRPAMEALVEYVASDVMNSAAVLMAVAVPTAAVGDSVARMLSPAYFDALRCEPGLTPPSARAGIRLFYGPEARVYCRTAGAEDGAIGDVVRASLILGRR